MPGPRRLSQCISEGDGIAVIVRVRDQESARTAEASGAKGLAVEKAIAGLRAASTLPVLWLGARSADADAEADAVGVAPGEDAAVDLETVVVVATEDELETALDTQDPEIFLLAPRQDGDDADPLDSVLELLPDVPAGKLAIAELDGATRDDVLALERAGFDAVLVAGGDLSQLVGERAAEF